MLMFLYDVLMPRPGSLRTPSFTFQPRLLRLRAGAKTHGSHLVHAVTARLEYIAISTLPWVFLTSCTYYATKLTAINFVKPPHACLPLYLILPTYLQCIHVPSITRSLPHNRQRNVIVFGMTS